MKDRSHPVLVGLVIVVVVVGLLLLFSRHWLANLWDTIFYPSLVGNGPEDLVSYVLIGGGVVYVGRWAVKEWKDHKAHVHAKLDHIIIHSKDVPNTVPGVPDFCQPEAVEQTTPQQ